ncbi:protein-disulfide reductase DsbD N-terminal domain-containing protein [Panacagrimonas sp.]|uniref:protein-disulfide reductase DsbD N-terminal domain-containing protein n=1 Tax=Panacagrimonas sp. TaxID=2480088 RepID=UPI003B527251
MRLLFRLILLCAMGVRPAAAGLLDGLFPDDGIVPVEKALALQPPLWDGNVLVLGWDIAPGCYLYRDKTIIEAVEPVGQILGQASWPAAQAYRDEHFGKVQIYRNAVQVQFRPSKAVPTTLRIRFQGCAEDKVCYPPQTRLVQVPAP